jgi:hypothetical protein
MVYFFLLCSHNHISKWLWQLFETTAGLDRRKHNSDAKHVPNAERLSKD